VLFAVLAAAGVSGAAPQGAVSKKLAGAGAATAPCGATAGGTVSYLTTNGVITQVTVTGLPNGCNGALVSLVLVNGAGTNLGGGGPVVVGGGVASVASLSANPAPASVTAVRLIAIGP